MEYLQLVEDTVGVTRAGGTRFTPEKQENIRLVMNALQRAGYFPQGTSIADGCPIVAKVIADLQDFNAFAGRNGTLLEAPVSK